MTKPLIAVTMGDPTGIGPEIIAKALSRPDIADCCRVLVLGDAGAMARAIDITGVPLALELAREGNPPPDYRPGSLYLRPLSELDPADIRFGSPTVASGDAMFRYITEAARLCLSGDAAAMATAPINKEAMNRAGHGYPGHTELLADQTGTRDYVMMLAGERLRVTLVTIHEAVTRVPSLVTHEKVLSTIRITHRDLERYFLKKPRLAVLALNPHCGEGGMFGDEEQRIIGPAVAAARQEGIDAVGPLSADTLFHFAARGDYDAVVCMYHDQGLIPLKLLHFDDGVNVTLGLPIIRTSVDHGTAYNLAGTGTASDASMTAAIRMAAAMANVRDRELGTGDRGRNSMSGFLKALLIGVGIVVVYAGYIGISLMSLPAVADLANRKQSMVIQVKDWRGNYHPFTVGPKNRYWTPSASIPAEMKWAVIVAEDANFYSHEGIDVKAIKNALKYDLEKKRMARGASTITQQVAKNLYLSREKTISRKIKEIILARRMEQELTKGRIIELYLNVIELGPMVYGIGHGAQYYFGKPAGALSPRECAFLAAMLPGPRRAYNPYNNLSKVLKRSDMILRLLRGKGALSEAEYQSALTEMPNITGLQRKVDESIKKEVVLNNLSSATVASPHAAEHGGNGPTKEEPASPPPEPGHATEKTGVPETGNPPPEDR